MQILITQGVLARTKVVQISRLQIVGVALAATLLLLLFSGAVYHYFFLKAAREGWPVVSALVKLVVRDEIAQRDRFMRENLDAMAQRVGEMQAKLVKLEAMGDRVAGLAGVKGDELKPLQRGASAAAGGKGGPYLPLERPGLDDLLRTIDGLDVAVEQNTDIFTLVESRLFEARLAALMVPSTAPVEGEVGSGFGFRHDPITGRAALHTGLDFPADIGTPIRAAAGGVVVSAEWHAQYGQVLEISHGGGLTTLYAHTSRIRVKVGDIVKRGQWVAEVGNTGRSTGPHLHFEVLVEGVPQNPARFLAGGRPPPVAAAAVTVAAPAVRRR